MDLSVDLIGQEVLQVIVSHLSVRDQTWHFFTSLLDTIHAAFEDANFFLELCKVVILVFDHSLELPAVNAEFLNLIKA